MQVDDALVDAHLEAVPGGGAFAARGLAGSNAGDLGREADGAGVSQALVFDALDELLGDLLEGLDLAAGERDADAVHRRLAGEVGSLLIIKRFE